MLDKNATIFDFKLTRVSFLNFSYIVANVYSILSLKKKIK